MQHEANQSKSIGCDTIEIYIVTLLQMNHIDCASDFCNAVCGGNKNKQIQSLICQLLQNCNKMQAKKSYLGSTSGICQFLNFQIKLSDMQKVVTTRPLVTEIFSDL